MDLFDTLGKSYAKFFSNAFKAFYLLAENAPCHPAFIDLSRQRLSVGKINAALKIAVMRFSH